jgi:hypothetical protein
MSERIVGSCGIVCTACPAYVARRTDDQALREKTAEEWSSQYGASITASDIDCDGCHASEGVQISHCAECEIRMCSQQTHEVENCGLCSDYPCERITESFSFVPDARKVLDGIRSAP